MTPCTFFNTRLILDAGNVDTITTHANQLRLRVEQVELPLVLDYIAQKKLLSITVDVVEQAVNELLREHRFIEPEE